MTKCSSYTTNKTLPQQTLHLLQYVLTTYSQALATSKVKTKIEAFSLSPDMVQKITALSHNRETSRQENVDMTKQQSNFETRKRRYDKTAKSLLPLGTHHNKLL